MFPTYTQASHKFLSLTLPPLPLNPRAQQMLLAALVLGLGLAVAWLPLDWLMLGLSSLVLLAVLLLRPILSVYLLIIIIPFSTLLAVPLGSFKVGLMEIVLGVGVGAWLLQMLAQHKVIIPQAPLLWPFLLFLGGVSLSWLNPLSIGASLVETAKWIEMLALYLLVVALLPARHLPWLVGALLVAGLLQAALGLYQFIFKVGPAGFLLFDGRFLRAYGTFAQPNPYAGYLGLILPLAFSLTLWAFSNFKPSQPSGRFKIYRPILRIVLLLSLGLLLAALFASQSRGAWLGFAGAAIVTFAARSKQTALLTAGAALLIVGASLVSPLNWGLLSAGAVTQRLADATAVATISDISTVEVNDANFATIERLAHWQAAREMWRDHPWLGVGFGNYAVVYPLYAVGRWLDPLGHAHNYLLNIGAETGLVGMTTYIIFWIFAFRVSLLALQVTDPFQQATVAGGLGILVHLHLHNLFDNLFVQGMYLHIAVILALISIIYSCHQTRPNKERIHP